MPYLWSSRVSALRRTFYEEIVHDIFWPNPDGETEDDVDSKLLTAESPVIWGTDWTAATLIDQLRRKNIQLDPDFQRREAWTNKRKSQFIESLVLGLPVPQLVLAEHESKKGRFIVIDGKQRLLTLARFAGIPLGDELRPLALSGLQIRKDLNRSTYRQWRKDSDSEALAAFEIRQSARW